MVVLACCLLLIILLSESCATMNGKSEMVSHLNPRAAPAFALLALAALACICGPVARVQRTAGTAQAVATDVGGAVATGQSAATAIIGTEEAIATSVAISAPTIQAELATRGPTLAAADLDEIRQWGISAMTTSQLSVPDYSAAQATGRPNTFACGQEPTAWASQDPSELAELTIIYADAVIPFQIHVHENFNPGFVIQVRTVDVFGDTPIIYQAPPQPAQECPRTLTINAPPGLERTSTLVITVDQSTAPSWAQIDAVELVGLR